MSPARNERRIAATFARLKAEGRKAFIPYVVAGDPTQEASLAILETLARAGASLIELGIPWSDPSADGPDNQAAMGRALDAGMTTEGALDLARELRRATDVPLVLMTYGNPAHRMGWGRFAARAAQAGADGLLLTDVPLEELDPVEREAASGGLDLVLLHAPTTPDARAAHILARTTGFLYVVARMGVTGTETTVLSDLSERLERLRRPDLNPRAVPLCAGFGISTREQLAKVMGMADGAIVGSILSRTIAAAVAAGEDPASAVQRRVEDLLKP